MASEAKYAAAKAAVKEVADHLIAERVPRMFQQQAEAALEEVLDTVAKAAVDAAEGVA